MTVRDAPGPDRTLRSAPRAEHRPGARLARGVVAALGAVALAGGMLSLLGWATDTPPLTDWAGQGISIQPNAALASALAGLALLAAGGGLRRIAAITGGLAGAIGALTLVQHVAGVDLGIDQALGLRRSWGGGLTVAPGRMGVPASTCWTLAGLGFVLLAGVRSGRRLVPAIGLVVSGVAALSITGYLFGADRLFRLPELTAIAMQTALFLLACGLGLVFAVPERNPVRTLLSDSSAGLLARRALPLILSLPLALGFVMLSGLEAGLYDAPMGAALLVIALTALLCAMTWRAIGAIDVRERALASARDATDRADRALHEKERLLAAFMEQLPLGVGMLDAEGRWTLRNPALARTTGEVLETMDAPGQWSAWDGEGRVLPPSHWPGARALRGEMVAGADFLRHFADGREAWYRIGAAPFRDEAGRIAGAIVVVQDVDEQKRAIEALAAAERQLRLVTDHAPVLIAHCDARACFKFVNAPYAEHLGLQPADVVGRSVSEVLGEEAFERLRPHVEEVLEGQPVTFEASVPYRTLGTRHMRAAYAPEWAAGRVVGFVAAIVDITDRKETEEALRRSESKFASVFHEAPLAMVLTELPEPIFTDVNEAWLRLIGMRREDFIGRTSVEAGLVFEEPHRSELLAVIRQETQVRGREIVLRPPDGREILASINSNHVELDGRPHLLVGVQDVTAHKNAEDALREADRRKNEFLATLAHELRNPLAPIASSLEVLGHAGHDASIVERMRATMQRQVRHMVRLIDDLLDVSRITRNRLELRRERVELASVVDQAVEACRSLVEAGAHELTVDLPREPVLLDADPVRLAQVLVNLLTNAVKFSRPGGPIRITAERSGDSGSSGDSVIVRVQDEGEGIPPGMLERVFELFAQVERPAGSSLGGLGIGLSLSRRLVLMHDGELTAHSEGAGTGTTMTLRLPALPGERAHAGAQGAADSAGGPESATDAAASSATATPPPARRRILVVDDNRDAALSLVVLLKLLGAETRMAHDGVEAVEAAEEWWPDAILLDIGLPRMSGHEACREIRTRPWSSGVMIAALTGWGQDDDRRRSLEAGFDAHLVKPVEHAALIELLSR